MGLRDLWTFRQDPPVESDEQLTDRARRGDESAFGELYRRHRQAAHSTASCLLRSKSDADDVVNDAFAGVLAAMRNGRGPRDNFRRYLLACVRNSCRARRPQSVPLTEDGLESFTPVFEDPERYVEANAVGRAFASLTPRWQHTLWLTAVEQLPASEVRARLRLSPNATAALTRRAREAFATAYLAEHVAAVADPECAAIATRLAAYVRNDLTAAQRAGVEQHLDGCAACTQAVDDLRDVNASLRSLAPITPTGSAGGALTTDLAAGGTSIGGTGSGITGGGLLLKGAAALLVVGSVVVAERLVTHDQPGGGDDVAAEPVAAAGTRPGIVEPVVIDPLATTATSTVPAPQPPLMPVSVPVSTMPSLRPIAPAASIAVGVPSTTPTVPPPTAPIVDPVVDPVVEPLLEVTDEVLGAVGLPATGEVFATVRALIPALAGGVVPVLDIVLTLLPIDIAPIDDGEHPLIGLPNLEPTPAQTASTATASTSPTQLLSDDAYPPAERDEPPSIAPPATAPPSTAPPATATPSTAAPATATPPPVSAAPTVPPTTTPQITIPPTTAPPTTAPAVTMAPITFPQITVAPVTVPSLLG